MGAATKYLTAEVAKGPPASAAACASGPDNVMLTVLV
jgi:hypothetical protein